MRVYDPAPKRHQCFAMAPHLSASQKKGKSMKPKARHTARYGHATPLLLPPNLHAVGARPFSIEDFAALDAWLAEPGWPDNHMDVAMLEGYLVALLTWPIELAPGAWLPPIWGIRGWKVAAKIAIPTPTTALISLVIGLFASLTAGLPRRAARRFVLGREVPYKSALLRRGRLGYGIYDRPA